MNVRPSSYRSVTSVEYDEYYATVRVPKGGRLARSRVTPGAHRGFTHSGNRRMEHAEIFLKGERKQERAPGSRTTEQEELVELLRAVAKHVLGKAAEAGWRYIKRQWDGQTPASIRAAGDGLRKRRVADNQPGPNEPSAVVKAALVQDSEELVTALEEYEPSMTSQEPRRHGLRRREKAAPRQCADRGRRRGTRVGMRSLRS